MATGKIGYDTGWYRYTNATVFTGTIYLRKIDKLFLMTTSWINLKQDLSANAYIDLADGNPIPANYRPTEALVCNGFINTGLVSSRFLPMIIGTQGTMYIYSAVDIVKNTYNLKFNVVGL